MDKTIKSYVKDGVTVTKVVVNKGMKTFPLLGILTIIFVFAKLFDKLDWSWFMVFWPMWISPAIFFGVIALVGVVIGLILSGAMLWDVIDNVKRRR